MIFEVFKDDQYSPKSVDNPVAYKKVFSDHSEYPSKIAILLKNDLDETTHSAIILNQGFSSGLPGSWLVYDDTLAILVGDSLYRLKVPELNILSISKADDGTTFEIVKVGEKLIVHGEQEISCFDLHGNSMWRFTGKDIFVSLDGKSSFDILEDCISLTDFEQNTYKLDFNGNLLSLKEKHNAHA